MLFIIETLITLEFNTCDDLGGTDTEIKMQRNKTITIKMLVFLDEDAAID
ncbi:16038_t:CDS:1, partial [Funneliformis mosseae]